MDLFHTINKDLSIQLEEWRTLGFITAEQLSQIARHEAQRPRVNWLVFAFISLAASVIGVGIISLVAANWSQIPDAIKLTVNFILLVALAAGILAWDKNARMLLRELLLILFMMACLASIGLISQVYHSGGQLSEALLLWSILIFPAATLSEKPFPSWFWTSVFLGSSLFWYGTASASFLTAMPEEHRWLEMLFALPLFLAWAVLLLKHWKNVIHFRAAFAYWLPWTALFSLLTVDFIGSEIFSGRADSGQVLTLGFGMATLLLFFLFRDRQISPWHKMVSSIGVILYALFFQIEFVWYQALWIKPILPWLGALFSILILLCGALYSSHMQCYRWSNLFILLIGFRFLAVYFALVGGYALTGLGLIFSGLLILALLWIWHKSRKQFVRWMESL